MSTNTCPLCGSDEHLWDSCTAPEADDYDSHYCGWCLDCTGQENDPPPIWERHTCDDDGINNCKACKYNPFPFSQFDPNEYLDPDELPFD